MAENEGSKEIRIVSKPITRDEARAIGKKWYQELVKGAVDIERGILALGGEYHIEASQALVTQGSLQDRVWGFNIYPDQKGDGWIEYISLINIRPAAGNRSMHVEDEKIRNAMRAIIERLIV